MKVTSLSDGRIRKNRTIRPENHCTACGEPLPTRRRDWGLVWETNCHGICVVCLEAIRVDIGFRYFDDVANEPPSST
jgi:predicted nucleic acid-binding Zn ribbon protein